MKTVLFTGGGTLGPVMPLLAVLKELKTQKPATTFVWVGTRNGPERRKIARHFERSVSEVEKSHTDSSPRHDEISPLPRTNSLYGVGRDDNTTIRYEWLPVAKFDRFLSFRILIAPFVFLLALFKSLVILLKYHPRIIIGAGSFTQVPLMWAGWLLGIPSLIHQQDVRVGLASRLCSPVAKIITVNFEVSAKGFPSKKVRVVGNPVFIPPPRHPEFNSARLPDGQGFRNENQKQTELSFPSIIGDPNSKDQKQKVSNSFGFSFDFLDSGSKAGMTKGGKPLLVVIGGGTGAEQLNRLVFLTAGELTKTFNIVLISGARDFGRGGAYPRPERADARPAPTEGLHIILFVDDSYHLLEKADLVVSRAGMGTLTELASLGKPALVVPIPHSHQVENALYYKDHGAAEMMEIDYSETESKAGEFVARLQGIWNNEKRKDELSSNIRRLYRSEAIKLVVEEINKISSRAK